MAVLSRAPAPGRDRVVSDPNVVRFVEQHDAAAAFEAHSQTDHFQEFEEALPDLLAGEPEVRQFEVDSATDLEL